VSLPVAIVTLALLVAIVLVVTAPLRAARPQKQRGLDGEPAGAEAQELSATAELRRDELESAREAKYREIRDAELDYRTGKLSREDYEAVDGQLRSEAIEILDRLEQPAGGGGADLGGGEHPPR
jgi:hypothetical protein